MQKRLFSSVTQRTSSWLVIASCSGWKWKEPLIRSTCGEKRYLKVQEGAGWLPWQQSVSPEGSQTSEWAIKKHIMDKVKHGGSFRNIWFSSFLTRKTLCWRMFIERKASSVDGAAEVSSPPDMKCGSAESPSFKPRSKVTHSVPPKVSLDCPPFCLWHHHRSQSLVWLWFWVQTSCRCRIDRVRDHVGHV